MLQMSCQEHLLVMQNTEWRDWVSSFHTLIKHLSVLQVRRGEFKTAKELDCSLQRVIKLTMERWPDNINNILKSVREYWKEATWPTTNCWWSYFCKKILVVLTAMKNVALQTIYQGHMRIEKCKQYTLQKIMYLRVT